MNSWTLAANTTWIIRPETLHHPFSCAKVFVWAASQQKICAPSMTVNISCRLFNMWTVSDSLYFFCWYFLDEVHKETNISLSPKIISILIFGVGWPLYFLSPEYLYLVGFIIEDLFKNILIVENRTRLLLP